MYICICQALNEKAVNDAIASGADTPGRVHRHHAGKVTCGKCIETISSLIEDHHATNCNGCGRCADSRRRAS